MVAFSYLAVSDDVVAVFFCIVRIGGARVTSNPWRIESEGLLFANRARGAKIYAEILGGSYTCDAHHMTEPNPTGEGVAMCIKKALADAGVEGSQVRRRMRACSDCLIV